VAKRLALEVHNTFPFSCHSTSQNFREPGGNIVGTGACGFILSDLSHDFVVHDTQSSAYAFVWCVYKIFHGEVSRIFDISEPQKVVFPPLDHLGAININDSWRNNYASLEDLRKSRETTY